MSARKSFYTRLPRSTYLKLRRLALLAKPPESWEFWNARGIGREEMPSHWVPVSFRFHQETYDKLRELSAAYSMQNGGHHITMQETLRRLIDAAKIRELETRQDMHDVVRQLIGNAKL